MEKYIVIWFLTALLVALLLFNLIPKYKARSSKQVFFQTSDELEAYEKVQEKELSWSERKKNWLLQSRTGISYEFFILLHFASYAVVYIIFLLVTHNLIISALLAILGLFFPSQYVKQKRDSIMGRFDEGLVTVLDRLVSHLRYLNFAQSLEKIAEGEALPEIIQDELKEMIVALAAGKSEDDALKESYERVGSDALRIMYIQTKLNRDVGMRLDELFMAVRQSLMSRFAQQDDARIQTKEMTMQANMVLWIVALSSLAMMVLSPDLFSNLTTTLYGRFFLLFTVMSFSLGTFLIKRIVQS